VPPGVWRIVTVRFKGLLGAALAVTVLALAACGGDSKQPPRTTTGTASATAAPSAEPGSRRTGIPDVDRIIDVVESGDVAAFMALLERFPEKCAANPMGVGSPPRCPPGVPDGGTVETFRWVACERGYESELDGVVMSWSARKSTLYAAFKGPPGYVFTFIDLAKGDYSLVFVDNLNVGTRIEVAKGRVIGAWFGCGPGDDTVKRMIDDAGGSFLVPPAYALAAPTSTPVPTADGYPLSRGTGVFEVDLVLGALESGNAARIAAHFRLQPIGCITEPVGIPSPPFCKEGQAKGTPVEVMPVAGCEGEYLERFELPAVADRLAKPGLRLFAVHHQTATRPGPANFPLPRFIVILNDPATNTGMQLSVDGGYIQGIWWGCGATARQLLRDVPAASFILAPP
jgi:hypothetical protein